MTREISHKFAHLNHLAYFVSLTTATIGIGGGILLNNTGMAVAGIGSAGITLCALGNSRDRAVHIAATLLSNHNDTWEQKHSALARERDTLSQSLAETHTHLGDRQQQIDDRQAQITELQATLHRLQTEKRAIEQTLAARLTQTQQALEQAKTAVEGKRHDLSIHLDAIEIQILDIWNPLYTGLIAICDRFDPSRPVSDLKYAGKPVSLEESEKRQWKHYRDSLSAYDTNLRQRINGMSDECDSHDAAYGFFLRLLEELTINYCKLWANIKDLELLTHHEGEKRAIYSEFESFRSTYLGEASTWVEQSTKVETGFDFIEQSFKNELASLQTRIVAAEQLIETLQAPRKFRGETSIDKAGNRIIDHFASTGVIVDAIESAKIPGGFKLRFKVDRNADTTRLTESEFDKHCDYLGLWGLSQRPLNFDLDTRNFLLSVTLYASLEGKRSAPLSEMKSAKSEPLTPEVIADRFQQLNCYSAAEFEEVIRLKFVPRVRVVAGSTGGKSPLLELIACAIAQIHKGQIWLINPIPGSPKDWFHVPGVILPGSDGIAGAIEWLGKAHAEFIARRNDLPGSANKPFITIVIDEINAIARDFPDLGTVMKDFYQLSDHTRMGFLTAGQGGNVSGVSGGSKSSSKTGNASKLMTEDFQNATQVFTAAAAKTWLEKNLKGGQGSDCLDRLSALNQLCAELNQAENKSAYPTDPTIKKVSPDAYRIALVVSPREAEPFFIQIPPYSSYLGRLEGVDYPKGAIVTAPKENQMALGLIDDGKPKTDCVHCGSDKVRRKGEYKTTGKPRYVCLQCGRVPCPMD